MLNHVGRGEDDGRIELGHMDLSVLNRVGRGEDDEIIEFKHLNLSFHEMNFPNAFAFFSSGSALSAGSLCSAG